MAIVGGGAPLNADVEAVEKPLFASFTSARDRAGAIVMDAAK